MTKVLAVITFAGSSAFGALKTVRLLLIALYCRINLTALVGGTIAIHLRVFCVSGRCCGRLPLTVPGADMEAAALTYNPLIYLERLPSARTESRDREYPISQKGVQNYLKRLKKSKNLDECLLDTIQVTIAASRRGSPLFMSKYIFTGFHGPSTKRGICHSFPGAELNDCTVTPSRIRSGMTWSRVLARLWVSHDAKAIVQ